MQNLNPTRIIARRGRDTLIIGAFFLLGGLVIAGLGVICLLLLYTTPIGPILFFISLIVIIIGIGVMVRGLTLRMENVPALAVARLEDSVTVGAENPIEAA